MITYACVWGQIIPAAAACTDTAYTTASSSIVRKHDNLTLYLISFDIFHNQLLNH